MSALPARLARLVGEFAPVAGNAGGTLDRRHLQVGLQTTVKHYRAMLWLAVGLATVAFVVELGLAVALRSEPSTVKALLGATGLTAGGALEIIRRLARDLAQTSLIATLCAELDSESLRPVLAALVRGERSSNRQPSSAGRSRSRGVPNAG